MTRRLLVPLLFLLTGVMLPLCAQVPAAEESSQRSLKNPNRDFDMRRLSASGASARPQDGAILEDRKQTIESFLASPPSSAKGATIVPNAHGLPKMFFRDGAALSPRSQRDSEEIAKDFLRLHSVLFPFTASEIQNLRLTFKDSSTGAVFLNFNQTLNGIDVFEGQVKIALDPSGQVVQAGVGGVVPRLTLSTTPRLTPDEAVQAAFRAAGFEPPASLTRAPDTPDGKWAFRNPLGDRYIQITAELSIFPMTASTARLAYRAFLEAGAETFYEIRWTPKTPPCSFGTISTDRPPRRGCGPSPRCSRRGNSSPSSTGGSPLRPP